MAMGIETTQPSSLVASILSMFFFFSFQPCIASDTISSTQPITNGQTIKSNNGVFELGFFSPGKSHHHFHYVGMWYTISSEPEYVWVANRENPLKDSSGMLTIGKNGNLVILDGIQNIVWSTKISSPASSSNSTKALLFDSGNLVLTNGYPSDESKYLWESFNHPTHVLLENMKVGLNTKTGVKQFLTSWKSHDDPSPGTFQLRTVSNSHMPYAQVIVFDHSMPHWRSGEWNGFNFLGGLQYDTDARLQYSPDPQGGMYVKFTFLNTSFTSFIVLSPSGTLTHMFFLKEMKKWTKEWQAPQSECDIYGRCGPFGICNLNNSPICRCLQGFEPKFDHEWKKGNWTGGCIRTTQLPCVRNNNETEDEFVRLYGTYGLKLPDFSSVVNGVSDAMECRIECSRNCSCVAYAFVQGIGCLVWERDLVDIHEFAVTGGQELFLRLAHSESKRKRKIKTYIIVLLSIGGLFFLAALACILRKLKEKQRGKFTTESPETILLGDHARERDTIELTFFNFATITIVTNNFIHKLGEGGYGPVYKGKLQDGQEVAVKRLSRNSGQGIEEFKNELKLISKLQHRNLVRLLGYCIEGEEKTLIYEYMPNKSLDAFLFDPTRRVILDWGKRFNIVDGIARGLLYLHRDSRLRVIHRDMKASNVLLDKDMNPKISDFGMARIFSKDQALDNTKRVVGTYGYMSPEYAMGGIFSEKSDVFSFGVLLLEIVSSKRNTSFYDHENFVNLLAYAWRWWNEGKPLELMDPALADSCSPSQVMRCIQVGLLCVEKHADNRPTMSTIVSMLGSETALPTPKQPAFTLEMKHSQSDLPSHSGGVISVDDVTITTVKGR